jgi:glutathione synthase/RimK-type ligase-like ATP-grasp enzyme
MSAASKCWGIYRETLHSPGRIDDDAAIMDRVGEALTVRGFNVELLSPDAADTALETPGANIFAMCERSEALDRLKIATQIGAIVVNSPAAIRNTYRHRMVELFAQCHVSAPVSQVVATDASRLPPATGVWIKRYDFHATRSDDVMYAASHEGWHEALNRFAERGFPFVVVQENVPGDLVKFYGVSRSAAEPPGANWFEWFYHRDRGMMGHAFDAARLRDAALAAAVALGLEIFGGDAIIQPDGKPVIIDLNAWPSFARYRDQAAHAIANHLADRFQRRVRAVTR